jgi:hypothetical protein
MQEQSQSIESTTVDSTTAEIEVGSTWSRELSVEHLRSFVTSRLANHEDPDEFFC